MHRTAVVLIFTGRHLHFEYLLFRFALLISRARGKSCRNREIVREEDPERAADARSHAVTLYACSCLRDNFICRVSSMYLMRKMRIKSRHYSECA